MLLSSHCLFLNCATNTDFKIKKKKMSESLIKFGEILKISLHTCDKQNNFHQLENREKNKHIRKFKLCV